MAEFDVVITGGMVIDGTRMPRYRADVGVKDGKIAKIGHLKKHQAKSSIDADGLNVVPGFVDLHTHYDAQLFWDPYCTISSWHGVTSVVIGNCGFGFAPVKPELRERAMLTMTRTEAIPYASMKAGMPWNWVTYPEFLDSVEHRKMGINLLPFMPLAPLLVWVMGLDDAKSGRMPTDQEHAEMKRLLHEAMDHGACGWSAQRLGRNSVQADFDGSPMVTDIMHDETALELASVLGERNEGFIQMTYLPENMSYEGDGESHAERHYRGSCPSERAPDSLQRGAGQRRPPRPLPSSAPLARRLSAQGTSGLRPGGNDGAELRLHVSRTGICGTTCRLGANVTIGKIEDRLLKLADPERRPALAAD